MISFEQISREINLSEQNIGINGKHLDPKKFRHRRSRYDDPVARDSSNALVPFKSQVTQMDESKQPDRSQMPEIKISWSSESDNDEQLREINQSKSRCEVSM